MAEWRTFAARHRGWIMAALAAALLAVALVALNRLTREVHIDQVKRALAMLSGRQVVLAVGFTACSYLALTFYDVLALRVIGRPLPWRTAATASFTSYTLSHNLGLSLLTGGSARYRVYVAAGLDGPDVARIVALAAATFWTGVIAVTGIALLFHAGPLAGLGITEPQGRWLGGIALLLTGGGFAVTALGPSPLRLFGFTVPLPGPGQFAGQLLVAAIDLGCASAALFVLVPGATPALLPAFMLAYALGIIATVVTHVPGGVGVFEAVVLAVLPGDRATLLAALLAYRLIYYLAPLAVGIVLLAWHEGRRQRNGLRSVQGLATAIAEIAPLVLAAAVFAGGATLLLSGALPSVHGRMGVLGRVLPLPFIEASHLAASMVGTLLLLLAPGLYRRLDGANLAARLLLLGGAVFSIAKGIDYEEAAVCLAIAALLQWTRGAFYRHTALTRAPFSTGWTVSVAAVFGAALWGGLFAFRHVPYSDDLWWRFALHGDASRFLRASVVSAVVLIAVAVLRLLAAAEPPAVPDVPDPGRLQATLAAAERTDAMLALTGGKRFLWSDAGNAFVMYAITGATWAVMGDPVGPRTLWPDLLWRLREAADRAQARLLLYEVSGAVLDLAIGMGLDIVKCGEEAIVDLQHFDLGGKRLRSVRHRLRVLEREGFRFRIVPRDAMPAIIDELAAISDEWLAAKQGREKRFSLGRFDRDYLLHFDHAIIQAAGRIVAFANLWTTSNGVEASIDLMRHRGDAPAGTMDFLFVQLLEWAKARGYARFSLGLAPLSGIDDRRLAPPWARAAAFAFRHGERLYGFRGLRAYKEKFAPGWEPRYIAGPHGLGLLLALRDVTRLIGGGTGQGTSVPRLDGAGIACPTVGSEPC